MCLLRGKGRLLWNRYSINETCGGLPTLSYFLHYFMPIHLVPTIFSLKKCVLNHFYRNILPSMLLKAELKQRFEESVRNNFQVIDL